MARITTTPAPFPGATHITVDRYHQLIKRGALVEGSPVELLDGFLVLKDRSKTGEDPMSIGPGHRWTVHALPRNLMGIAKYGVELQTQQPVTLPPDDEPEPDGAIIAIALDDYRGRKPSAAEVHCVIEVADSSLEHDRTTKYRAYAAAGIRQYVIINLADRQIESYANPSPSTGTYGPPTIRRPGEMIEFWCGGGNAVAVPVEGLLP